MSEAVACHFFHLSPGSPHSKQIHQARAEQSAQWSRNHWKAEPRTAEHKGYLFVQTEHISLAVSRPGEPSALSSLCRVPPSAAVKMVFSTVQNSKS